MMAKASRPPAVLLMGPTCSGKTGLAVALVERGPYEIINVDSALVYQGLNIGAARPPEPVLARAPHRLLGFRDPRQPYSAAEFREDALHAMAEIQAAGKIPLLVGGTMLYFRILVQGMSDLPAADEQVRATLEEQGNLLGWPAMHARLGDVDPVTAARLEPNDRQRIQRALEVYHVTGRPLSDFHQTQDEELSDRLIRPASGFPYTVHSLVVAPTQRAVLHQRIAERFEQMLADGLIDEVAGLRQQPGMHAGLPAMRSVGYRQIWEYLDGQVTRDEAIQKGIVATRQLAKRQFTWLRRWADLHWFDSLASDLEEQVTSWLACRL